MATAKFRAEVEEIEARYRKQIENIRTGELRFVINDNLSGFAFLFTCHVTFTSRFILLHSSRTSLF
jgi:hypothetical protein